MTRLYFVMFEISVRHKEEIIIDSAKENFQIEYGKAIESLEDVNVIENMLAEQYRAGQPPELPRDELEISVTLLNWKRFE